MYATVSLLYVVCVIPLKMPELLSSRMTIEELLLDYLDLEKEDFLACIEYAAKLTQIKSIYRIAS